MNNQTTKIITSAKITRRNRLAKRAVLLLLLGGSLLQGQAGACPLSEHTVSTKPTKTVTHPAQKNATSINPDYYQSSDNPYRAD